MSHPRREQLRRLLRGALRAVLAALALGAALPIATAGDGILAFTLVLVASGLALAGRRDLRLAARNRIGAESEAAVRQALDALTSDGWHVRHAVDWPSGGDLDHVVRAPSGMGFVIETKTLRYGTAHLQRTARAARWLGAGAAATPTACWPSCASRALGGPSASRRACSSSLSIALCLRCDAPRRPFLTGHARAPSRPKRDASGTFTPALGSSRLRERRRAVAGS